MEVYDRILSFVDSGSMRAHLQSHRDELCARDWLQIVTHAPRGLEEKADVLRTLARTCGDKETLERAIRRYEEVNMALERLRQTDTDDSILLLEREFHATAYGQTDLITGEAVPFRDLQSAEGYMKAVYAEEYVRARENRYEFNPNWFWTLSLFCPPETDPRWRFTCSHKGEMQYFRPLQKAYKDVKRKKCGAMVFSDNFYGGDFALSVPYQPGDILYIDCRPYNEPVYCLITDVGDNHDGGDVRCLSPACCGLVRESEFGGWCFERHPAQIWGYPHISPLFRAEIYDGGLPEEYVYLERISRAIKWS